MKMPTGFEFTLQGGQLPQDHGYLVLAGLTRRFPFLHGRKDVQIAPIRGTRTQERHPKLKLDAKSMLHIRGISEDEAKAMEWGWVRVGSQIMGWGQCTMRSLAPAARLVSRHVIFDGVFDEERFLETLFARVPKTAEVSLGRRRTLSVHDTHQIGWVVVLGNLSDEDSLAIQQSGIGRHTSMGCGVFYPSRH